MTYLTDIQSSLHALVRACLVDQTSRFGRFTMCCALAIGCAFLLNSIGVLQANTDVGIMVVTNKDVEMPKSRRLPNGERAALAAYAPSKTFFNSRVLGQSDTDVARIWSKLKFAGRQDPPRTFDTVDEVVAYVKNTTNALAYLPGDYRGNDVRVMSIIPADAPALR